MSGSRMTTSADSCCDSGRISIIVPVYNEGRKMDKLLDFLMPLRGQCEIFFVDGGSSDDTVKQIADRGGTVAVSPQKGRAYQMNHGASLSSGEILWFLHADSFPPAAALCQIREVFAAGYKIGCFPIRFDSQHPLMVLTALLSNLRVRMRNIAFGDQGIFLHKALFEALGGYAAIPLMEDYQLSLDVTKATLRIGMARGKIITSQRRYLAQGRLKTIGRMWSLQRRFRQGDSIEEIARAYNSTK